MTRPQRGVQRIFIDGEWNGYRGELISFALVPEQSGHSLPPWYVEVKHDQPLEYDPWVVENVLPHLRGSAYAMPIPQIQLSLQQYLAAFNVQLVEIFADWPEDVERLCRLLITGPGERLRTPALAFFVLNGLGTSQRSTTPHNALEDARAIRKAFLDGEREHLEHLAQRMGLRADPKETLQ